MVRPERGAPIDGRILAANMVMFGRLLRRAGLAIDADQTRLFARALAQIGLGSRADVKAAGRAIMTRRHSDRDIYDRAFDLFWRASTVRGAPDAPPPPLPRIRQSEEPTPTQAAVDLTEGLGVERSDLEPTQTAVGASERERLRSADFATLTPAEARDAEAMIAALRPAIPRRPARRPRQSRWGHRLAGRVMLRRSLASGGEVVHWRWLRRTERPRPLVLVCDVSGSMERYTRFMLRFAHALTRCGAPVEVFVFGTRLTRITRELRASPRRPDQALSDVAKKVVDWSGGTRIGESVKQLNRTWVRRVIRSSAVVLMVSDGWERGDPALLAREMATLRRSCHRLIWLDPLAERPGFEPATQGLKAALPHVDAFLPAGSVASLEEVGEKLGVVSR